MEVLFFKCISRKNIFEYPMKKISIKAFFTAFVSIGRENVIYVYEYKCPDAKPEERVRFSSPWRSVWCDRVRILENAKVSVSRGPNGRVVIDAKVPFKDIRFDLGQMAKTFGDVGGVRSDATGTRAAARVYWANKDTALMSDLPAEVSVDPARWGGLEFE